MIARTWHGRTKSRNAEAYLNYVTQTGIQDLTATEGNKGAQIWQQQEGDITHIRVISWWDNLENIKAFAGEDISRARYYEADADYLLELEKEVQHFECYDFSNQPLSAAQQLVDE